MKIRIVIGIMSLILLFQMVYFVYLDSVIDKKDNAVTEIGKLKIATDAKQLIIVSVAEEEAVLLFYEKQTDGDWIEIIKTTAIIGKNGLGKTREGDMKTPMGEYRFTKAFGILENPGAKMEYTQVDESYYWVDDMDSKYYNQFVSTDDVMPDWNSAEHICEYGELYHYVLATSYNEEAIPGAGSAVFLHCATEDTAYTAGCVAIPEEYMRELLQRVEEDCVLVIDAASQINDY